MTLAGIDFKNKTEALRVTGRLVVETLVAVVAFVTVVRGPLWPIGRLHLLNTDDVSLAADGIYNANAERMFSWVALCSLVIAVAMFVAGGYYGYRWYAAALFAGMLYVWLTCAVFEFKIIAAMKWFGYILLAILAALVLAVTTDKNSKVEPVTQNRKMAAYNIIAILFLGALVVLTLVFFAQAAYEGGVELYRHFALKQ